MTSSFMQERRNEKVPLANLLKNIKEMGWVDNEFFISLVASRDFASKPHTVAVLFSGGPAPGGHNVIAGIYDGLMMTNPNSQLLGFIGGAAGLLEGKHKEITSDLVDHYRGIGGFDLLGTGRGKIETEDHFRSVAKIVEEKKIDAIIFIGGDDTNTNAAHLASFFRKNDVGCCVVGIPKTIDGDLKTKFVEASFGFDTACKVYSEMIGNICFDACSSLKYWHFIKLMGRKASHVTLECALNTQPNLTFIGEEVAAMKQSLSDIVRLIADTVVDRSNSGKEYGVCLLPEGLIEFVPEFKELITHLNRILAANKSVDALPEQQKKLFLSLPQEIGKQLLKDRDPHGNVQVSKIETEKLIFEMVDIELKNRNFKGKFNPQGHFFGYEGRCACPSFFDAAYCYNLGFVAVALVNHRKSGMMAALSNLHQNVENWTPIGVPINSMMVEEERKGEKKRVIEKSVVKLEGAVFKYFKKHREEWRVHNRYENPGPIQYFGEGKNVVTKTLSLEAGNK